MPAQKMPSLDFSNPQVMHFLLDNYEKESRLRLKWVRLHADNIEKAATFTKEEKNYTTEDILKTVLEAGMATTTRDHITAARHRTTAPDYLLARVGANADTEAPMKPVPQEDKGRLLESRVEYLKKRSLLKPEDKFSYVECTNWVYGWRYGDSGLKLSGPAHGQVHHMMRNQLSRVGPQRDPEHYNTPDKAHMLFITI